MADDPTANRLHYPLVCAKTGKRITRVEDVVLLRIYNAADDALDLLPVSVDAFDRLGLDLNRCINLRAETRTTNEPLDNGRFPLALGRRMLCTYDENAVVDKAVQYTTVFEDEKFPPEFLAELQTTETALLQREYAQVEIEQQLRYLCMVHWFVLCVQRRALESKRAYSVKEPIEAVSQRVSSNSIFFTPAVLTVDVAVQYLRFTFSREKNVSAIVGDYSKTERDQFGAQCFTLLGAVQHTISDTLSRRWTTYPSDIGFTPDHLKDLKHMLMAYMGYNRAMQIRDAARAVRRTDTRSKKELYVLATEVALKALAFALTVNRYDKQHPFLAEPWITWDWCNVKASVNTAFVIARANTKFQQKDYTTIASKIQERADRRASTGSPNGWLTTLQTLFLWSLHDWYEQKGDPETLVCLRKIYDLGGAPTELPRKESYASASSSMTNTIGQWFMTANRKKDLDYESTICHTDFEAEMKAVEQEVATK